MDMRWHTTNPRELCAAGCGRMVAQCSTNQVGLYALVSYCAPCLTWDGSRHPNPA